MKSAVGAGVQVRTEAFEFVFLDITTEIAPRLFFADYAPTFSVVALVRQALNAGFAHAYPARGVAKIEKRN